MIVRIDSLICVCHADTMMMECDDYPLLTGTAEIICLSMNE